MNVAANDNDGKPDRSNVEILPAAWRPGGRLQHESDRRETDNALCEPWRNQCQSRTFRRSCCRCCGSPAMELSTP
jgi:hypothetical protein